MRFVAVIAIVLTGCGVTDPDVISSAGSTVPATSVASSTPEASATGCANVVGVEIVGGADDTYTFHVTVASADEGWDKYADEWTVQSLDGVILGVRTLAHPHETEQPFTRSLSGVVIPGDVTAVRVAARDSVVGYCGEVAEIDVP